VLDRDQDRTNLFSAAQGDKKAMRPFAKLLWIFIIVVVVVIIIIFLAHWYFIPRGVKTKQIGEISGMVILRTRKLKMSWPGILS